MHACCPLDKRQRSSCRARDGAPIRRDPGTRMLTLHDSVCVDAPVDQVWAALARLEDIVLWSRAVHSAV